MRVVNRPVYVKTAILLLAALMITGCSSGSDTIVEQQQQTHGQQLIDLKTAFDKGIITEREYNKSRDAIVDKMKN